jgi:hypothetical protein
LIVRKDIRRPEKSTDLSLRVNYRIETYQSPFPSTWTEHHGELVRLGVKRLSMAGNLQYDKEVDNFNFNLKGQVKLNSRISVQMAAFVFHVPRPRFLGASKSSSVSPYQLQGTLQLQNEK